MSPALGAVQVKHFLTATSDDMNVSRTVIVRVNHDPESEQPQNRRHYANNTNIILTA